MDYMLLGRTMRALNERRVDLPAGDVHPFTPMPERAASRYQSLAPIIPVLAALSMAAVVPNFSKVALAAACDWLL